MTAADNETVDLDYATAVTVIDTLTDWHNSMYLQGREPPKCRSPRSSTVASGRGASTARAVGRPNSLGPLALSSAASVELDQLGVTSNTHWE
jgi:hypothetical protein